MIQNHWMNRGGEEAIAKLHIVRTLNKHEDLLRLQDELYGV